MEGATAQQSTDGARISNDQINSLQVLIQAAQLSCKRGAFSLEEAESVSQAVKLNFNLLFPLLGGNINSFGI